MIAKIVDNNTIEVYDLSQFDADAIIHSGQVFRYFEVNDGYLIIVGNNFCKITSSHSKVIITSNNSKYFYNYFDFDTDYNEIKRKLQEYEKIKPAIIAGGGIRILRSEFIEMVVSFIISANNNIKRFKKTLNLLAERYGDKLKDDIYAFPNMSQLETITEAEFKDIGCGYRSLYLKNAILKLKDININYLKELDNKTLLKHLCLIDGVGQKVASCIALFTGALHRQIAPIDTHIKKALATLNKEDVSKLLNHEYAGIAQQYIYYYLQYLQKKL